MILLPGRLLRRILRATRLEAALAGSAEMGVLADTRIIFFGLSQSFLYSLCGGGAAGFLDFARDFRALGGDLLAERRTIKL